MIFNSVTYILLLIIVVPLYWAFPYRIRLILVFFSSLLFYAFWRVDFLWIMLLSVFTDYIVALNLPFRSYAQKKMLLFVSLGINLGLLFYFKYLLFFANNAIRFANIFGTDFDNIPLNIILPLGISFYTFQTISYTVDVYRGFIKPEKDFILYACYVTFFPQLIAGPILRASEVIHQFAKRIPFSWENVIIGLRRIIYGLFLKVVLADNISPLVDDGFLMPVESISAIDVWTLAFLFGFQIYFDFSAYSHIALGSSRIMGIYFPENFHFPYMASSPKDFWRRWHISLSSWIRDYLYLPLAGIKVNDKSIGGLGNITLNKRKNRALFATWAIMGLWHGANWTFVLWGIFHAFVITAYRILTPLTLKLPYFIRNIGGIAVTIPLMMLAWIPFRSSSIDISFAMWLKIVRPNEYWGLGMKENIYLVTTLITLGFVMTYFLKYTLAPYIKRKGALAIITAETLMFSILIPLVIVFLRPINQFIYFQF